jgi:hypothetical protein
MENLLKLSYWFNPSPPTFIYLANVLFVSFLIVLFLAGIFFMTYKQRPGSYKKVFSSLQDFSFANLFLGLLFFFFDQQNVYFFSARFWYVLWIILMGFWIFNIIKKIKKISSNKEERKKYHEFKKYLP